MKKVWCGILALTVLFGLTEAALAANLPELIRVTVTGDNVNLRSAPNAKGKVLGQASTYEPGFIVESVPIQDKGDNSQWYKIIFVISEMDDILFQTSKSASYEYSNPYISAKFVKKMPLDEGITAQLNYFKEGRPVSVNVGDDLSKYWSAIRYYTLKKPLTIRKEPYLDAATVSLPVRTVITVVAEETYPYWFHTDMEDANWNFLMDENQRLMGWLLLKDWKDDDFREGEWVHKD